MPKTNAVNKGRDFYRGLPKGPAETLFWDPLHVVGFNKTINKPFVVGSYVDPDRAVRRQTIRVKGGKYWARRMKAFRKEQKGGV